MQRTEERGKGGMLWSNARLRDIYSRNGLDGLTGGLGMWTLHTLDPTYIHIFKLQLLNLKML